MRSKIKILVIRFSSFGDVIQALSIASVLKKKFPESEIHWVTLNSFVSFCETHKAIDHVWSLKKSDGKRGLKKLTQVLKSENFTHIYDAHNSVRSLLITSSLRGLLGFKGFFKGIHYLRRSRYPLRRFFLFRLRINLYPKPFVGQWALMEPLKKWGVDITLPEVPQVFLREKDLKRAQKYLRTTALVNSVKVALSPSASYELKRWPTQHWIDLVKQNKNIDFILLGGPEDDFISQIQTSSESNTLNLSGKLSFEESSSVIQFCDALISSDTGLMHIGEQLGKPTIALMGPAPFGFPGRKSTHVMELDLSCRPCSKHGQGPCTNKVYQKCLVEISPKEVSLELNKILLKDIQP